MWVRFLMGTVWQRDRVSFGHVATAAVEDGVDARK
jgi:hypothetical protein